MRSNPAALGPERPVFQLALDAQRLSRAAAGVKRYVHALCPRLLAEHELDLTVLSRSFFAWHDRATLAEILGEARFALARSVPAHADIIWHPAGEMRIGGEKPSVLSLNDLSAYEFPAEDPIQRGQEQSALRQAIELADAIVVPSYYLAELLTHTLGVQPERITVIPYGVDTIFSALTPNTRVAEPQELYFAEALAGRPYILHVGDIQTPKKNFATLYDAWRRAFPAGEVALVTTRAAGAPFDGVIGLEHPEDSTLAELYRGARCVAVPTIASGFSSSMLEAMACGTPTIAARTTSLPEIGGNAPYWITRSTDIADWVMGLRRLIAEPQLRTSLRDLGLRQAQNFSWQSTTNITLGLMQELRGKVAARSPH